MGPLARAAPFLCPPARYAGAMISDRDIQATALLCIRQHGQSAAYFAAGRADELLDEGAIEGAKTWRRILAEIERMQAMEPAGVKH